jgi:hypothetical protein
MVIDTTTGDQFVGRWILLTFDEKVKHEARVHGEIKGERITFEYQATDILKNGGGHPSRFTGTINRRELSGSIELLRGGPWRGRFDLTRK